MSIDSNTIKKNGWPLTEWEAKNIQHAGCFSKQVEGETPQKCAEEADSQRLRM